MTRTSGAPLSDAAREAASDEAALATPRPRAGTLQRAGESELAQRVRRLQGFAVARDYTPIYYRIADPATAALPVVFNDGIGCDGYVWKYLEQELSPERKVVHWHYRGHGNSGLPRDPERVTIADCADDLLTVLDTTSTERAVLCGHSMGVQVCLEAYRRSPQRVAGLVLLCGSYGNPLRTFKGKRVLEDMLPLVRFAVRRIPRLVTAFWKNALPTDLAYQIATLTEINGALIQREDFFPYLEHMARVDVRLFLDMLAAAGRHTAREILGSIEVPTLIIAGERDSFTPLGLSEEMHKLIPGSELHVVRDGSHTAPIEKPQEVNDEVARFVRERCV